jgi:(4S)-4-hydroxy-5-phosphonooxypentane-2,3-dione isomerase
VPDARATWNKETGPMLVVLVHVTVRPDLLADFERAILANADGARTREPGCIRFEVNQSEDDPTRWMFYEVYTDAAAFEAHRASAHFGAYQQVADRALVSKTLTRWTSKA